MKFTAPSIINSHGCTLAFFGMILCVVVRKSERAVLALEEIWQCSTRQSSRPFDLLQPRVLDDRMGPGPGRGCSRVTLIAKSEPMYSVDAANGSGNRETYLLSTI